MQRTHKIIFNAFLVTVLTAAISAFNQPSLPGNSINYTVSPAGDVSGDGYADVIVGANYYDDGETNDGRIAIYLGSSTGLSKTPYFTAEGDQVKAFCGKSVACAGDVNHDGYSDVIVGAPGYDHVQNNQRR